MADCTSATPDLTAFDRFHTLGLKVTGQFLEPDRAVLAYRVLEEDRGVGAGGGHGRPRDSATRRLAHEPFGWRRTILLVSVGRYRCDQYKLLSRHDLSAAQPRARLSRGGPRCALTALDSQQVMVARIGETLGPIGSDNTS